MYEIPLVAFSIDRDAKMSLQKQIQSNVVSGIINGIFPEDTKMPSSRALSTYLGISRITVSLAYAELASLGVLYSKDRAGYFIASAQTQPEQPHRHVETTNETNYSPNFVRRYTGAQNQLMRPENWFEYPYCFVYGQADASIIDHHNWRQCSLEAIGRRDFDTLAQDSYEIDDPLLVQELLRLNLPRRGIYAEPDQVLVTMGALNALWICAQLFLDHGKTAIMENPGYPTLRALLDRRECQVKYIDVDAHGLPPERIPNDCDVVFTTPSHHCPTNASMPTQRRLSLIEEAKARGFLIVEDDYEFENQLRGAPKPALKSLDQDGHVIYIGSFSKSLFPGLRLGYMVASPEIIREARALRGFALRSPPTHIQRTVAYFQSLGYYDRQLKRLARAYRERHDLMEQSLIKHGLEFVSPPEYGGSSFWMKTDQSIDTQKLAIDLQSKGVLIEAGAPFFANARDNNHYYRLAYSTVAPHRIDKGVGLIRQAIDAMHSTSTG